MWGKGQQDVLFFLTWKCTDAGREEYLQFIWKDNEHLLRCYLWTWRNKVVLWQIFIIILCSLLDTGWFGGFFQFKHSKHFLFLCVMHIGKYSCFTCSLEFKIHEEKDLLSCQMRTNITGLWCPQVCCWWVPPLFSLDVQGRLKSHTERFQACIYECTFNFWAAAVTYNLWKNQTAVTKH